MFFFTTSPPRRSNIVNKDVVLGSSEIRNSLCFNSMAAQGRWKRIVFVIHYSFIFLSFLSIISIFIILFLFMKDLLFGQTNASKHEGKKKLVGKLLSYYQSQVSILGPVGYGPTTLPLRHSDCWEINETINIYTIVSTDSPLLLLGSSYGHYLCNTY